MAGLFAELKRRNVIRVAVAYGVSGWLIAQVATTLEESLNLPEWFDTTIVAVLLIGFPIALIISWAYEITPEGLKKTSDADAKGSIAHKTSTRLDFITIGAVLLLIISFFSQPYLTGESGVARQSPPKVQAEAGNASIAVLPFVDLSPEGDQEYFSDGISEEILNVLAKTPDLHVTSRSSAFAFKNKDINIPEVARQLGVAHVLEGSVRKSGTTLRITAQLIEAGNDRHLWSETYDRELENIFEIQDEISAAIVDALKASLGIKAGSRPVVVAKTANPEAYTEFLLGQHAIHKRTNSDIKVALGHFQKAIELDNEYAPAFAGFALAHYLLSNSPGAYGTRFLEEALRDAEPALARALKLDPLNSDVHAVQGLIFNARRQFEKSAAALEKAIELNPSNTDARVWYAQTLGDMGRAADQFEAYKEAYEIDPLAPLVLTNYLNELNQRQMFMEQEPVLARLETIQPDNATLRRSLKLRSERRIADSIAVALQGAARYPNFLRLRTGASISVANLGLAEEGRRLWPFPDNMEGFILATATSAERLQVSRSAFEADPENPGNIYNLMFGYWSTGDLKQAETIAKRIRRNLPENRRDTDFANWVLAVGAWQRGDNENVDRILKPLERQMREVLKSGITGGIYQGMSMANRMRGERQEALRYMQLYVESGEFNLTVLRSLYDVMQLTGDEEFERLFTMMRDYVESERRKLLVQACAEPGFDVWQPLPATCELSGSDAGR